MHAQVMCFTMYWIRKKVYVEKALVTCSFETEQVAPLTLAHTR
jgi:hypothetical protein